MAKFPISFDPNEDRRPPMGPQAPISEPILAKLEQTQPDLVARYRQKMATADLGVADAQKAQDIGSYGNVAAKIATDFENSQKKDTIYQNNWSHMGQAPQIDKAERKDYDGSAVTALGNQGVQRAMQNRSQSEDDFMTGEKLADMQTSRNASALASSEAADKKNPKSAASQAAQKMLLQMAPKTTAGMDVSQYSAEQIERIAPEVYNQSRQSSQQDFQAGQQSKQLGAQASENQKNRDAAEKLTHVKVDAKTAGYNDGVKALDKDYAKDYNDFTTKGRVNAKASIARLKAIQSQLENESKSMIEAGGGKLSVLPDAMRSQKSIELRDDSRNAANATLKSLFGGQLSDGERTAAANEFYNDKLDSASNAARLASKIQQMEDGLVQEDAKADYFRRYGSLNGYKGPEQAPTTDPLTKPKWAK